jgi:transposase-like protein
MNYSVPKNENNAIEYVVNLRWGKSPVCPYCNSERITSLMNHRFHCNSCNTSFSVTSRTFLHKTKIPLRTWFLMVKMFVLSDKKVTTSKMAQTLSLNKNTITKMQKRIKQNLIRDKIIIEGMLNYE